MSVGELNGDDDDVLPRNGIEIEWERRLKCVWEREKYTKKSSKKEKKIVLWMAKKEMFY